MNLSGRRSDRGLGGLRHPIGHGAGLMAAFVFLSQNFLRGSTRGQINAVYRDRERHPERVVEYREALSQGAVRLVTPMPGPDGAVIHAKLITKQQAFKLNEMGIGVPPDVRVGVPRRPRAKKWPNAHSVFLLPAICRRHAN